MITLLVPIKVKPVPIKSKAFNTKGFKVKPVPP
jgi:hypothetical protein